MSAPADPRDAIFSVDGVADNLGAKTGRSATLVLIFAVLRLSVTVVTTAFLARLVPPEQQGLFALAVPAVIIASGLSEFGLAHAVVRSPHVTHRLASTLFWVNVGLGLLLAGGVMLLARPAAAFYGNPAVAPVFVALTPYILFSVMTGQFLAILRRRMRIRRIETANFTATVIAGAAAVAAAFLGAGHWALALQLVLAQALVFAFLAQASGWMPSPPWAARLGEARGALNFGGFVAAERLVTELTRSLLIIVIGRFFTSADAALYYRSNMLAQMPQKRVVIPLAGAFVPSLSRLQDDPAAFRAMYRRIVTRTNFLLIPVGLLIMTCADVVVWLILGPNWSAATPILAWLGLLPLATMAVNSLIWTLIATGHSRPLFAVQVLAALCILAALLMMAGQGLLALVAAYILTFTFGRFLLLAATALRHTPLTLATLRETFLGDALFALAAGVILGLLRSRLELTPVILEGVLAGLVLAALCALRLGFNPELRDDILKALKMKRGRNAAPGTQAAE